MSYGCFNKISSGVLFSVSLFAVRIATPMQCLKASVACVQGDLISPSMADCRSTHLPSAISQLWLTYILYMPLFTALLMMNEQRTYMVLYNAVGFRALMYCNVI